MDLPTLIFAAAIGLFSSRLSSLLEHLWKLLAALLFRTVVFPENPNALCDLILSRNRRNYAFMADGDDLLDTCYIIWLDRSWLSVAFVHYRNTRRRFSLSGPDGFTSVTVLTSSAEAALLRLLKLDVPSVCITHCAGNIRTSAYVPVDLALRPTACQSHVVAAIDTQFSQRRRASVLLYGPPGTGKTTAANFWSAHSLELGIVANIIWFNEGAPNLSLHPSSRRPCVIVVNEIDLVLKTAEFKEKSSASALTLAQLLSLLDYWSCLDNVIVVATLNGTPDDLPKAIIRLGRFNQHIEMTEKVA